MPLAVDLFAGLGGWSEGLIAVGYEVVGFDITRHQYGDKKYPAQLVLQDILTVHGSQFKDAAVIVASPPCQNYSYLAMPWSKSKDPNNSKAAKALCKKWETEGPDNRLFDACFRIQREAIEAAGRYIPLIVENVRGAQEWVGKRDMPLDEWKKLSREERLILGRARAKYGSFYLWGDVEQVGDKILAGTDIGKFGAGLSPLGGEGQKYNPDGTNHPKGSWFRIANSSQGDRGRKSVAVEKADYGGSFGWDGTAMRKGNSHSSARAAASAQIAKIPPPLSQYIARAFKPEGS